MECIVKGRPTNKDNFLLISYSQNDSEDKTRVKKTQSLDRKMCERNSFRKLSLPIDMYKREAISNWNDSSKGNVFEKRHISPYSFFKRIAFVVKVLIMLCIRIKNQRNKGYWSRLETQTAIQQQLSEYTDWKLTDFPLISPRTISGTHIQELLHIPSHRRSRLDEDNLLRYLEKLHTVQDFPLATQTLLARVMTFESFEAGRIIIKENHPAMAVYFVWHGSVYVNQKETDVRNDRVFDVTVNILKPGDWFGERGVLHKIKHNITVVTRSYVELLVVDEKDFHNILAHSVLNKTKEFITYLEGLPILSAWNFQGLLNTPPPDFIYAKYFRYNNVVIKYSPSVYAEWIVTIKKGCCRVVLVYTEYVDENAREKRKIDEPRTAAGKSFLPLIPPSFSLVSKPLSPSSSKKAKKRYVQLCTVEQGECFGLQLIYNKPVCKICIISRGSECIFVNRQFFLKQTNSDIVRLYKNEKGYYPEKSKLISAIHEQNKWKLFKKHVIRDCLIK